jgi:hypothetical protein
MYALVSLVFAVVVVSIVCALIESATGIILFTSSPHWFDHLISAISAIGIFSVVCWIPALPFVLLPDELWVARHGRNFVLAGTLLGPLSLTFATFIFEICVLRKIEFGPLPRVFYIYSVVVAFLTSGAYLLCMRHERKIQDGVPESLS